MKTHHQKQLARLSIITLCAVYVLIFAGGVVRSTGAGMGCPDWPKCFGKWVPPLCASELPQDYQKIFLQKRLEKNARLAHVLESLGAHGLAQTIGQTPAGQQTEVFHVGKAWTEYINRMLGVMVGLLITIIFFATLPYYKKQRHITFTSMSMLMAVILQGGLGAVVVSTHLLPWLVTVHMLMALGIIALLIYLIHVTQPTRFNLSNSLLKKQLHVVGSLALLASIIQIVLGSQVRECIDAIATVSSAPRATWVMQVGGYFTLHRWYALLVVLLNGYGLYLGYRSGVRQLYQWGTWLILLLGFTMGIGAVLAYMGLPRFVQPMHLLLATLIFGIQLYFVLLVHGSKVGACAKSV